MCFVSNPKDSRSEPKSFKSFVSSRRVSFGKFHWRPRMPSWRNWSFNADRKFLGRTKEIHKIVSSPKGLFFKTFYWSRRFQFWHPCRKHLPTSGTSLFRISTQGQKYVFFSKKNIISQSVSLDTWNAFLTNLLKMFRQENGFSLLIGQRSKIFGFSRNFFYEMFRWTRRMPIWGTWSFLVTHSFLGKTMKWYRTVSSSGKTFFNMFLSSRRFRLEHPCRKLFPKIQKFFLQNQQTVSNLWFSPKKKTFCLKVLLWTHEVRCWKLR